MEQEFDAPIFKILAHNDTGQAVGHQGGIVVPKDLDPFFPQLARVVSADQPTVDRQITAYLFDGSTYLGTVGTRYQFQTWGGTRSPERRITGNITPLRNIATVGDILLIQRGVLDGDQYRLTLVRKSSSEFQRLLPMTNGSRWGVLDKFVPPVREIDVEQALSEIAQHEQRVFNLFDDQAELVESRSRRVSRSRAFQLRIVQLYGGKCALCGGGLVHPSGKCEVEAAHIVPRNLKGSDDARNGLLMCRSHHWAFDSGMIGVDANFRIVVPGSVLDNPANASLAPLRTQPIRPPDDQSMLPHLAALRWHEQHVLID